MPTKAVRKYLEGYAEPEAKAVLDLDLPHFDRMVALVACGEGESLFESIETIPDDALAIVIINAPEDAPDEVHEKNANCLARLQSQDKLQFSDGVLTVDCASVGRRFPAGAGVGHARKVSADVGLSLFANDLVSSPWIHCTDADALLPDTPFQDFSKLDRKTAAALRTFWHEPSPDTPLMRRSSGAYEVKLRYHVLGLRHARSPYAFHTIGSTISLDALAYAAVRGFPKRNAAEDFYLLNKLAKVGPITSMGGPPITVQGRVSQRVPFGTGQTLTDLTSKAPEPFVIYNPAIYDEVAKVMDAFVVAARNMKPLLLPPHLDEALTAIGDRAALDKEIARARTPDAAFRNLHTRFDAFRTLKLVHYLRDAGLPSLPIGEAVSGASFLIDHCTPHVQFDVLRRQLAAREQSTLQRHGVPTTLPV